jgi:hypothetical protein
MSNGDELGSRGARRIRRVRNPTPIDVFEHGIVIADGDPPNGLARVATTREPIYSGYTLTIAAIVGWIDRVLLRAGAAGQLAGLAHTPG